MTDTVRVPREPTEAMARAFRDARPDTAVETEDGGWSAPAPDWFHAQYAAMLAASPQGEGSPAEAQGWRDIATAPRDGREIIAYSQDVSGTTGLNPFVSLCAWHPDAGFCTCELREVTHWMPFPPLPSADPAPIKTSDDTGELRERIVSVVKDAVRDFEDDINEDWKTAMTNAAGKAADAILDLIQSERAG